MNQTLMVVDDSEDVRHFIEDLFSREEMRVIAVDGGKACLQELEKGFQGVILLDIMMPEMDGWDTIRQIVERGFYKGIIICMLTAKDVPDRKMERLAEYVIDYFVKPMDQRQLVARVKEYFTYIR